MVEYKHIPVRPETKVRLEVLKKGVTWDEFFDLMIKMYEQRN
jgi:hypothetical protein